MAKKKLSALELILKKLSKLAMVTFATKDEVAEGMLYPVDISTLTPNSTFDINAVIGINGVLYRSLRATNNFPVTLTVQDGAFVTQTVNGKISFVVSNPTVHQDWEVWTDASIEYWVESINQALSSKQSTISDLETIRDNASSALKPTSKYTANGVEYTVDQLMQNLANLMPKTVVVQN